MDDVVVFVAVVDLLGVGMEYVPRVLLFFLVKYRCKIRFLT